MTALYAAIFTLSLFLAFVLFYEIVLYRAPGISPQALTDLREDFREWFGTALIAVIVFSAVTGWLIARNALSGVRELTRAARAVSKGALYERVPVKGSRNEIDRLLVTFNTMLERIQLLIAEMKEVNDNIAHDLRSPITRVRGTAEMMLTGDASDDERLSMAGAIVEECDRLLGIINTMLDISEAEAGLTGITATEVDIVSVAAEALGIFQPLAEDRNLVLTLEAPASLAANTDLRKLQRIISNLLDNAIKFTPEGGTIRLHVLERGQEAVIRVEDTGTGIPEDELHRIFDRFYRGEQSRSEPGSGLGLSLARAFVKSLGGSITAESTPGRGSTFQVVLPRLRKGESS